MYVKLPESARQRKRSFGGAAVSTLVHGVLIGSVVVGTTRTVEAYREPVIERPIIYVAPRPPEPQPRTPREPSRQLIPSDAPVPPDVNVPPLNLSEIREGLPPVDRRIGTISEREFLVAGRDSSPIGPPVAESSVYTELMVERSVQASPGNPSPRYPSVLSSAGVEGSVFAQFVVDTTGRVEMESVVFPRSDHQLFERAVREVLARSRYAPAMIGSRRVRQLVEQGFTFGLRR